MQKKLLTALIKSKSKNKKTINQLKDEFIEYQTKSAIEPLEEFLASLLVYIHKNYEKIEHDSLLKIIHSKLKDLQIKFDTKDIDDIYERFAVAYTIKKSTEVSIVFDAIDLKAIEMMRQSFYWVQDEYGESVQEKLKGTIEDTFNGDITREQLADTLKNEFDGVLKASSYYFNFVADHVINQSQNISRVNQALKYDTQDFQVKARIDKKTSDICRSMHGRIIPASHLKAQVENILDSKSIASKKAAATWKNNAHFGKLPANFRLPPYHGKCRTEVRPVWLSSETIDGKKVKFANKKKDDIISHIDKTGVQRKLKQKNWDEHINISRKGSLKHKDIIAALNSIEEIAPHRSIHTRTVARSSNYLILIFEADEIVTVFKPDNKKYFKNTIKTDKKEVIKWNKESLISAFMEIMNGQ
jgi:hypothetical protein